MITALDISNVLKDNAAVMARYYAIQSHKKKYVNSDKGKAARAKASNKYYLKKKAEGAKEKAMAKALKDHKKALEVQLLEEEAGETGHSNKNELG
jgi:hypothetical protein